MCPDRGSNPQPWPYWADPLTNRAIWQGKEGLLNLRGLKPCTRCLSNPKDSESARRGVFEPPPPPPQATSISRSLCGQGLFVSSPLLLPLSPAAGPESAPSPPLPSPVAGILGEGGGQDGGRKRRSGWNLRSLDARLHTWRRRPSNLPHAPPRLFLAGGPSSALHHAGCPWKGLRLLQGLPPRGASPPKGNPYGRPDSSQQWRSLLPQQCLGPPR